MVILGVMFDESRMFELLRLVRTFDPNRLTPVVCVLASPSALSDVAIEGLDHAVKAMLATPDQDVPDESCASGETARERRTGRSR
jgi:hypothetical protein